MTIRDIVHIDDEKCDGCGLCVPSCEEGAIQLVDGKAKVVSDVYCDGLGACLGHCPRGAISIVQREAEVFDEEAVARHLANQPAPSAPSTCGTGCPGSAAVQMSAGAEHRPPKMSGQKDGCASQLANWPVQLHLVPPHAPFLQKADLLLVADCVPFACANFHTQILDGRPVVIGCPKLDDCQFYVAKLTAIIQHSQIQSVSVVHMEVPCCTGLLHVADAAIRQAGVSIPLSSTVVTRHGDIIEHPPAQEGTQSLAPSHQLPIL